MVAHDLNDGQVAIIITKHIEDFIPCRKVACAVNEVACLYAEFYACRLNLIGNLIHGLNVGCIGFGIARKLRIAKDKELGVFLCNSCRELRKLGPVSVNSVTDAIVVCRSRIKSGHGDAVDLRRTVIACERVSFAFAGSGRELAVAAVIGHLVDILNNSLRFGVFR